MSASSSMDSSSAGVINDREGSGPVSGDGDLPPGITMEDAAEAGAVIRDSSASSSSNEQGAGAGERKSALRRISGAVVGAVKSVWDNVSFAGEVLADFMEVDKNEYTDILEKQKETQLAIKQEQARKSREAIDQLEGGSG